MLPNAPRKLGIGSEHTMVSEIIHRLAMLVTRQRDKHNTLHGKAKTAASGEPKRVRRVVRQVLVLFHVHITTDVYGD